MTDSEYANATSDGRVKRSVGPALHVLRVHRTLTQVDVATELSRKSGRVVQQSYISRIESGSSCPSFGRFMALCKILEADPCEALKLAERLADDELKPRVELERELMTALLNRLMPEMCERQSHERVQHESAPTPSRLTPKTTKRRSRVRARDNHHEPLAHQS
jgi:transcriptional regulator with XRE-family HTH domain